MEELEQRKYLEFSIRHLRPEQSSETCGKISSLPLRGPGRRHHMLTSVLTCGTPVSLSRTISGSVAQLTTTQYLSQADTSLTDLELCGSLGEFDRLYFTCN